MRILLVGDNELARTVIAETLSEAGHEATETPEPLEALSLLSAIGPSGVVISDIDLGAEKTSLDVAAAAHRMWLDVQVMLTSGRPPNRLLSHLWYLEQGRYRMISRNGN
jgi:CheY-like chemotaxis protein